MAVSVEMDSATESKCILENYCNIPAQAEQLVIKSFYSSVCQVEIIFDPPGVFRASKAT